ncbi:hypothetical protein A2U01_0085438, partial [Trifolium medium]|nr:hypothetical protein [Trifolium medium]
VAGLVGVELSAVAIPASFPYDASQLAPVALDIVDASLAVVATPLTVVATSEPTYYLQGPSQVLLPLQHTSLASRIFFELQTLYFN